MVPKDLTDELCSEFVQKQVIGKDYLRLRIFFSIHSYCIRLVSSCKRFPLNRDVGYVDMCSKLIVGYPR